MVYFWAILAALCATSIETIYRLNNESWLELLPVTIIPQLALNYLIFRLLRESGSILTAFIVFSVCTFAMRITSALVILHDRVGRGTWAALGLVLLAQIIKWAWK